MSRVIQLTDTSTGNPVLVGVLSIETAKGGAAGAGPTTIQFGGSARTEQVNEDLFTIQILVGVQHLLLVTDNSTGFPVLVGEAWIEKALGGAAGAGPVTYTFGSNRTEVSTDDLFAPAAQQFGMDARP